MNKPEDIKTPNAVQCRICEASADLMKVGMYVCQKNPLHVGDTFVGIFTDLSREPSNPGETK